MKSYTKVYFKFFGYDESSWIECECGCGKQAVDIHHLEPKSLAKHKMNWIENLCALTRNCHIKAGKDPRFNNELKLKHRNKMLSVNSKSDLVKYISEDGI